MSALSSRNPTYGDLVQTIQFLLDDRERLSQRLKFAERTMREFSQQAQHANSLTRNAQQSVVLARDKKKIKKRSDAGKPSTWIGGSWLAPSENILAPAEKTWQDGNAQQALVLVEPLLRRHDLTVSEDVNANLFISAILRASGDFAQASKYAEDALVIAQEADAYMLASKCEFHRGLSFLKLNRFAQAQWCLVLASHLEGHQDQIEANRVFAEERSCDSASRDPDSKLDLGYI
ncbi:MAG: hypothetical protein LQ343_003265 [Gyalolechia ehrenbergii]|nr:MAG: hypothetical protein LQ343_003265 [Gyalolechia ehrenbergii]